jgi:hypothetical protein
VAGRTGAEAVLVERCEGALEGIERIDGGAQGVAPVVVAGARIGQQRLELVDEALLARDGLGRRAAQARGVGA